MNVPLWQLAYRLVRYKWVYVQKSKKIQNDVFVIQGSRSMFNETFFSLHWGYKIYRIKLVTVLMRFKTTHERIFCDLN